MDDTIKQFRLALQRDRADLPDRLGDDSADDIEARQARQEWARLQVQLRFGGGPPRKAGARP